MARILIVDDDPGFQDLLEIILSGEGYDVETGASLADAVRLGSKRQFDLVLTDLRLPDADGLQVLRWSTDQMPGIPVIMITAYGTLQSVVEAMKLGAENYLGKPLQSPDQLRLLIEDALRANQGNRALAAQQLGISLRTLQYRLKEYRSQRG